MTETEDKKTKEEDVCCPSDEADSNAGQKKRWRNDPEELREVLGTISTELPKMIRGIMESFFSADVGSRTGKSVADFYRNLKEAGMPEQEALAMSKEYLRSFTNWTEILKGTQFRGVMKQSSEEQKKEE